MDSCSLHTHAHTHSFLCIGFIIIINNAFWFRFELLVLLFDVTYQDGDKSEISAFQLTATFFFRLSLRCEYTAQFLMNCEQRRLPGDLLLL